MWIGRSHTRGCDCSGSSDARLSTSVAAGVVISPGRPLLPQTVIVPPRRRSRSPEAAASAVLDVLELVAARVRFSSKLRIIRGLGQQRDDLTPHHAKPHSVTVTQRSSGFAVTPPK